MPPSSAIDFSYAYLHTLNPFAIHFFGNVGIRWYGLAYLTGFLIGYWIIRFMVQKGLSSLSLEQVGDFVFSVAIGTVIGGRLGYCLFYSPSLFTEFSSDIPFWGVLAINRGGMASHGGIAGIVIACLIYARKHKLSGLHLMDLTTLGGTAGIFFGRLANFVNGELVGRPISWAASWAVKFPQDIFAWPGRETQRLFGLGPVLDQLHVSTQLWAMWVQKYYTDRNYMERVDEVLSQIVQEVQNGNLEVQNALAPLLTARHPSQLYEALLEGLFLFTCLFLIWKAPRKPGVITGWFLSLYSIVRIFGEQFRMPDIQIGFQWLGLTRGQWLSVAMLLIGLTLLAFCQRREGQKLGGWAGKPKIGN